MTPHEIEVARNEFKQKVDNGVRAVTRAWITNNIMFYVIQIGTLTLAALVAFEPLLRRYLDNRGFWDLCAVLVLLLLLFDLGMRPGIQRRGHLNFKSDADSVATNVSLIDPTAPNALLRLEELNARYEELKAKHRAETDV